MATKPRRRRALSAEEQAMSPAERKEMSELRFNARFNAQSRHYHSDIRAIDSGAAAKPVKDSK